MKVEKQREQFDIEFYKLTNVQAGDKEPFGLLMAEGPVVSRWLPGRDEWIEAPQDQDYLMGNEPGAKEITPEEAQALMTGGKLRELTDESIEIISTFSPDDDEE